MFTGYECVIEEHNQQAAVVHIFLCRFLPAIGVNCVAEDPYSVRVARRTLRVLPIVKYDAAEEIIFVKFFHQIKQLPARPEAYTQ